MANEDNMPETLYEWTWCNYTVWAHTAEEAEEMFRQDFSVDDYTDCSPTKTGSYSLPSSREVKA